MAEDVWDCKQWHMVLLYRGMSCPEKPPTGITSQSFLLAKHGVLWEQLDHSQMESEGSRRQE